MKKILAIILALTLVGCGTTPMPAPEPVLVKQVEYVVRIPPAEAMSIPAPLPNLNIENPNLLQSDIADWILGLQDRIDVLEGKIIGIAKFLKGEQDKLNADAAKTNTPK